ncbi:MAG: AAA family ATPase [Candidatus Magasanikbacteria bacterium]|nr:AAA family ATPase [Candidatus Magasanikbacteria bacterium]
MKKIQLSEDQKLAFERLYNWAVNPEGSALTLGGYAGTGKTTLISILRKELRLKNPAMRVAFASYTGKASQVLRSTLEVVGALYPEDSCGTIHSLLYKAQTDKEGKLMYWKRAKTIEAELIVIDEASMVTGEIWNDLLLSEKPVIALGDHGQLPPISGTFNLMEKPDIVLEKIHRQAVDNPIIQIAHEARVTGVVRPGKYAKSVRKFSHEINEPSEINDVIDHLFENFHDDMLVLCGRNKTRVQINNAIRTKMGREGSEPEVGDKVVCLKNNYDHVFAPIYNGMTGYITSIVPHKEHWYEATIDFPEEGRTFDGLILKSQFGAPALVESIDGVKHKEMGDRFDFGYALTVHKAQGSQARTVVLFEERFQKSDDDQWRRWLYTAVTRARENLYIIGQ